MKRDQKPFYKRFEGILTILGIILLVLISSFIFYTRAMNTFVPVITREEFVARTQQCLNTRYSDSLFGSVIGYTTRGCTVWKEVSYVSRDEPAAIRILFSGLMMRCRFRQGEFDMDNFEHIMKDLGKCEGSMKDVLLRLRTIPSPTIALPGVVRT